MRTLILQIIKQKEKDDRKEMYEHIEGTKDPSP